MEAFGITTLEGFWLAVISAGIGHYFWHRRTQAEERKEQDRKISDQETALALLKQRVDGDHRRFEAQEKQLKEIASCNVEIKLVLERICAKLDTAPPSKARRPVAGSK